MSKQPLVSVIIPTYNTERIIERCLKSIKSQTYPKVETLIIDDSSTDNTQKISKKYANVFTFLDQEEQHKKKLGIQFKRKDKRSAQRNFGAKKAKGDYIFLIDSDMELPKEMISECVKEAHKGYDSILMEDRGIGTTFWSKAHAFEKSIHKNEPEVTSPRFIKRSVFLALNGIDESLVLNEDIDLHDRMKKAGYKIGHINLLINHHESDTLRYVIKKYFHYGKSMYLYAKKNPGKSTKLYILYHPYLYIKNWKEILKNPVYGIGSIVRKIIEYSAALTGMLYSIIMREK